MYTFAFHVFSGMFIIGCGLLFPVLHSRNLFWSILSVLIVFANPTLLIYPSANTFSPLVTINIFSVSVSLFQFENKFICIIFYFFLIFKFYFFKYNDFFSIIAGLQCSVNFLLYSMVTQLHICV